LIKINKKTNIKDYIELSDLEKEFIIVNLNDYKTNNNNNRSNSESKRKDNNIKSYK